MGGASLVAGAVFGFQAISKKSDAEAAGCKDNRCPTEAAASTRNDARSAGNLATTLIGSGAALVGAAVAVWILKPGAPASVQVEAGPTAITVSGAWR